MSFFYRVTPPRNPVICNRTWSVLSDDYNSDKLFASCDREEDAQRIVVALNLVDSMLNGKGVEIEWTCGHRAGGVCAECYRQLARKANKLAGDLLKDGGENEQRTKARND